MKSIPLSRGKHALVDDEDYEALTRHKWHYQAGYAFRWVKRHIEFELMHRRILGTSGTQEVDHIDGDGLNNTRANLRPCTHAQNMMNKRKYKNGKSQFKGVRPDRGIWKAEIRCGGRYFHLGRYANESEAALAYDAKAQELFGEFARLNFATN